MPNFIVKCLFNASRTVSPCKCVDLVFDQQAFWSSFAYLHFWSPSVCSAMPKVIFLVCYLIEIRRIFNGSFGLFINEVFLPQCGADLLFISYNLVVYFRRVMAHQVKSESYYLSVQDTWGVCVSVSTLVDFSAVCAMQTHWWWCRELCYMLGVLPCTLWASSHATSSSACTIVPSSTPPILDLLFVATPPGHFWTPANSVARPWPSSLSSGSVPIVSTSLLLVKSTAPQESAAILYSDPNSAQIYYIAFP